MFKTCPKCKKSWKTLEDLVHDPEVKFCGHQKNLPDNKQSLALFNHKVLGCDTTFTLNAKLLNDHFNEKLLEDDPNTKILKISHLLSLIKK